jgi:hypothetical protein
VNLDGDADWTAFGGSAQGFIDDVTITGYDWSGTYAHSDWGSIPVAVTILLGGRFLLSRMILHQHAIETYPYIWGNPKTFEIYTCDHTPSPDGNWDEWTRLINVEIIKPSSIPGNTISDIESALAGDEIMFPHDNLLPAQYVRVKFTSSWELDLIMCAELTFYGDVAD